MSRKYHFVAMLVERQPDGTTVEDGAVVARYEFDAISEVGALRAAADLVFDWPAAPAMLARALDVKPKELRALLGQWRNMHCSTCNETHHILDERVQGGFDIARYACRKCGTELFEVPRDPVQLRYDWRHPA